MISRRFLLVAAAATPVAVATRRHAASAASIPNGWTWVMTTPSPNARVGVVGDSLVYQAEHGPVTSDPYYTTHRLIDRFNDEQRAARVAAKSGATTTSLPVWGGWQSPPTVIVMALGTNDLFYGLDAAHDFQASKDRIRAYLDRWPSAFPVLVGVKPSAPRGIAGTAPGWNTWLASEARARDGAFVDWAALSASHPEWFVTDQLHHTTAGQGAYRVAITEGVREGA